MELQDVWNIIYALGALFGGYLTVVQILDKVKSNHAQERVTHTEKNSALELKVKELEGLIATQYSELKTQLLNLERVLAEDKAAKLTFESRVLSILDKTDSKIERIQDLVLRTLIKHNQEP
jgi:translation initiation factor IF-3